MKTHIYLKMDAKEALLLSEGVCWQLGIVNYHSHVSPGNTHREKTTSDVLLPTVQVQLVETLKLRPRESVMAEVRLVGNGTAGQPRSELMPATRASVPYSHRSWNIICSTRPHSGARHYRHRRRTIQSLNWRYWELFGP